MELKNYRRVHTCKNCEHMGIGVHPYEDITCGLTGKNIDFDCICDDYSQYSLYDDDFNTQV
jgi:hypothetical protein